ncbi:4-dihydrotrisporin dehydrogenase [Gongronella butleri]|nr:4-dihydrotrisporin dehydrogenase [Gongronella butleri]
MPQTIVITGTSRGLGLEFVRQLAAKGEKVIATARNVATAKQLAAFVDNKSVYAVSLDVASPESVKTAFAEIERIAPEGVDILINNAGISGDRAKPVADVIDVFSANVGGVLSVSQAALPLLRKKSTRTIVNISSALGSIELNLYGGDAIAYSTTKAALNMLTKTWSSGLKDENFTIVAVEPGWSKTDLGGENAPLEVHESVTGMLNQLYKLDPLKNGTFFDYKGEKVPW